MNLTNHPKGNLSPNWKGGRKAAQHRSDLKRKKQQRIRSRLRYQPHKLVALSHYSKGRPRCAYCGIDDIDVLCIDRIAGGDKRYWEQRKAQGELLFTADWLKENEYPEGYQILCYNCNHRKTIRNKEMRKYITEEGE